jgi:hypothetical protein
MDSFSFDRLARFVGEDASRRGVLRSAAAAAVVGLGITALLSPQEVEAKSCQKKCKQKAKQHGWSKMTAAGTSAVAPRLVPRAVSRPRTATIRLRSVVAAIPAPARQPRRGPVSSPRRSSGSSSMR